MAIQRQTCPFHGDEDVLGRQLEDGSYSFTCESTSGHPGDASYSWLHDPTLAQGGPLTGLAEELGLAAELPAAVAALGQGWFEYGLVEREYARRQPAEFRQMVERWGHTAIGPTPYSASAYTAGVLGRLATLGEIYYRPGRGTGRWAYNSDISYWSVSPDADWDSRTTWMSVVGDESPDAREVDAECHDYVDPPEG